MRYLVTAEEMKYCDRAAIENIGIPAMVLMERAALAVADALVRKKPLCKTALIVAGSGNNGGDGLAVGRILAQRGIAVDFLLAGKPEKMTKETACQASILANLGFSIHGKLENREYDIIVDALFGIGLSRNIDGEYVELIEKINRLGEKGAYVCSVDIPSGICTNTGRIMGCAVRADMTVTFAYAKRGEFFYPGREYTGELLVRDIGITDKTFGERKPEVFYYEKGDIRERLPIRDKSGNKGTFGKVLLVAGSRDMSGACILSGTAVLRAGAGMVKIITPACNREILQCTLPEAMLYTYEGEPEERELEKAAKWADVIVAGPGMGVGKTAKRLLAYLLEKTTNPMVLDADGLNLLALHEELFALAGQRKNLVLTPHPGELTRLLHTDMEGWRKNRLELAKELADKAKAVVAAKDAVTVVLSPGTEEIHDGKVGDRAIYINASGNDAMATAGSGDVLAGLIGSLLAQGMEGMEAASLGVYLHGLAGEAASRRKGNYGVIATDLIEELMQLMKQQDTDRETE